MTMSWREIVTAQLRIDEDLRLNSYRDSVGKLTVGYGHNIDDNGLMIDEPFADKLLDLDIDVASLECHSKIACFGGLDDQRKAVLVNMMFNMGWPRLKGFVKFLEALSDGDYEIAAAEMRDSKWYAQVGARAERLASIMESA